MSKLWYYSSRFLKTHVHFRVVWAIYLGFFSIIGAIMISYVENLHFIDAIYITVGSISSSGLSTISMDQLSTGTFCIMFFLMMIGGSVFMTTGVMIYKRYRYQIFRSKLAPESRKFYIEYDDQYEALGVAILVYICYWIFWNIFGTIILFGALSIKPFEPELKNRNFSPFLNALFLTISSFSNSGYTLSSSSVTYLSNNPFAYLILTCFIAAGNTLAPVFLRWTIILLKRLSLKRGWSVKNYDYILKKSRRIVTNIFSDAQTNYLAWVFTYLFLIQFVVFLSSSLRNTTVLNSSGLSPTQLAGVGFFQAISTRAAGLAMIDMRALNQGMLAVYALMMYLSSAPFISVMFKSEESTFMLEEMPPPSDRSGSFSRVSSIPRSQSLNSLSGHLGSFSTEPDRRAGTSFNSQPSQQSQNLQTVLDKSGQETLDDGEHIWTFKMGNFIKRGASLNRAILWKHNFFLCLLVMIIAFFEDAKMNNNPQIINLWYVIFEVVSAYGNVGLSFGVPGESYALSGYMSRASKLAIIFVMLMGKHRGLPHSSDAAIDFRFKCLRLPGSRLEDDPEDHEEHLMKERISQDGSGWLFSNQDLEYLSRKMSFSASMDSNDPTSSFFSRSKSFTEGKSGSFSTASAGISSGSTVVAPFPPTSNVKASIQPNYFGPLRRTTSLTGAHPQSGDSSGNKPPSSSFKPNSVPTPINNNNQVNNKGSHNSSHSNNSNSSLSGGGSTHHNDLDQSLTSNQSVVSSPLVQF